MPGAFSIDLANRLVISAAWGIVTDGDLLDHARALKRHPRFEPSFSQVIDFRHSTELRASSAGVRILALENPFGAGSRRAVLVATDYAFGMARMYELLTGDRPDELHVYRDEAMAFGFLAISAIEDEVRRTLAALPLAPPGSVMIGR